MTTTITTASTNNPDFGRLEIPSMTTGYVNTLPQIAPPKRTILISPLDSGYTIQVGCKNVAIETIDKLIKNLTAYLKDPAGFEEKWHKNKKLL